MTEQVPINIVFLCSHSYKKNIYLPCSIVLDIVIDVDRDGSSCSSNDDDGSMHHHKKRDKKKFEGIFFIIFAPIFSMLEHGYVVFVS